MFSQDSLSYDPLPLPDRAAYTDAQMQEKATEFLAHMQRRHTVRDFTDQPVPRQVIEDCIRAAGTAPSGANHQPWFFAAVSNPELKARIRAEAEEEERKFYAGGAGDEWIKALEPIGTNEDKPHLTIAPWLIVVFAQRWGEFADGTRYKNYYVPESVNIATGVLLTALHTAGLVSLTHTPNPMKFLNGALGRPASEKPTMIIAVGHPAEDAMVPSVAKFKKPLEEICQVFE
ncbi:nitroreductase [Phaeobacter gallaeciensis]|jgi:nitroreductase|uniref:Nitroreductase n=1 Tax=Phaeobacter gallaeciensis TaxID=60890 RepID=A0A1B0ZNJ2_9RHOB|nr:MULTISPECIES: nitroreductase family protein [Phaeobacter]MDF1770973.1 nitroreductase family protein [Pseudophaeobacter sp. bin_em_oilr2.035]MEE2635300.1 nitroreductase family protein [Pseudomonadota bacterium]ANP35678.1 nitroreductase [Phaeobacter gallaeciensis]MDE4061216.1 nitroreductase family protein [Phaeobacter gallaeciensis]MDE4124235.1 nitroreductase family protein [Phaeobacter gallaeciensis]